MLQIRPFNFLALSIFQRVLNIHNKMFCFVFTTSTSNNFTTSIQSLYLVFTYSLFVFCH